MSKVIYVVILTIITSTCNYIIACYINILNQNTKNVMVLK